MLDFRTILIEVLVGSRNLDAALPTARAEVIVRARVVERATVDGQVIIVEARVHRSLGCSNPNAVLVLAEHRAATASKTKADDDRLGIGSYHTEACIPLTVHLRILLSRLIHGAGTEIFLGGRTVKRGIEVLDGEVSLLGLVVLVEGERMVVHAQPRVAVTQIPEGHTVDDILMLAEYLEDAVVLVGQHGVEVTCQRSVLTTREAQLTTHLLIDTDVKLRHVDVLDNL